MLVAFMYFVYECIYTCVYVCMCVCAIYTERWRFPYDDDARLILSTSEKKGEKDDWEESRDVASGDTQNSFVSYVASSLTKDAEN